MFPGFSSRLLNEIKYLYKMKINKVIKINIDVFENSKNNSSAFCGATILANNYNNESNFWITNEEYEENGEKIILQKLPDYLSKNI